MRVQPFVRTTPLHKTSLAGKWPGVLPRDLLSRLGALTLLLLVIVAVVGPLLPLGDPRAISVGPRLAPPSPYWPLGLDSLGRSLLPRVVEGTRYTFLFATVTVTITVTLAIVIGLLSAYRGGLLDLVVVRLADVGFSFPGLLMAMLIAAVLGPGATATIIAVVVLTLPYMTRVVRAAGLSIAERDYVVTAEVGGASTPRILFIHLLPNAAGPIIVQTTFLLSGAMLLESGLSFLGLGVQPPNASLGSLVSDGSLYLLVAPWLVFAPGGVLSLAILSANLLGDGLRDLLDPRAVRVLK